MMTTLQVGQATFTAEEIIPLLVKYQIMPQLIGEYIIDQAIAAIDCTPEETAQACHEFYQRWPLTSEAQRQHWRSHYGLNPEQVEHLATRRLRVDKFKQATWGPKLESYFLTRKRQLDRVIYSSLRVSDPDLANELFFRIQEGEQSFAELARLYSEGSEARTGGLIGPVEFGALQPRLADFLYTSPVGIVQPPLGFAEKQLITRVELVLPAQLDQEMRRRLLQEKFEQWFQEQLNQLSEQDKIWMGVTPTAEQN